MFMDISTKYLRQAKRFDNGIEAFSLWVTTMWNSIDDEEMYLLGASQFMEEFYLFPHPL